LRNGARALLTQAVETEVADFLGDMPISRPRRATGRGMMTSSHRCWSYRQSISYPKNAAIVEIRQNRSFRKHARHRAIGRSHPSMDLHLNDKSALVTGSTAGIGLEIARKLAVEGAKVIITGRNKAKLDQAVDSIRTSGGAYVSGVLADAATEEGTAALVRATPRPCQQSRHL
jgi:3-oxoacyl-ACP reductase-like protein